MCDNRTEKPLEGSESAPLYNELQNDVIDMNPDAMHGWGALPTMPEASTFFPWPIPVANSFHFSPVPPRDHHHDNFFGFAPGSRPSSSSPASIFQGYHRLGLQFGFERPDLFPGVGIYAGTDHVGYGIGGSPSPFGLQAELSKLTAQEIMDAKALAASKNHSEAERRRRGRINGHLDKLRTLLPNATKTDKASLLAEVIQHVKELKRQMLEIAEVSPVPTETDELTVDPDESPGDGKLLIKASICCEDRSDLLSDLIKALKSLRLRTLKAEITTLGGRVRNVLVVTGEDADPHDGDPSSSSLGVPSIGCIQEALRAVMERHVTDDSTTSSLKRQRTNLAVLDHRSI
ncbi:transcription factor bHLH30-like [Nymphaea colorata]|nr:transcription factor bHLH30-like [Nymphaea colorata]